MQGWTGVLVLALTTGCVFSVAVDKCGHLKKALNKWNISSPEDHKSQINQTNICGSNSDCCDSVIVGDLNKISQRDLEEKLKIRFEPTHRGFKTLAKQIKDDLGVLWLRSERETLVHLGDAGAGASLGREATRKFYSSLWTKIERGEQLREGEGGALFGEYLKELFPEVYLGVVHVGGSAGGREYRECLLREGDGRLGAKLRVLGAISRAAGLISLLDSLSSLPSLPLPPSCSSHLTRLFSCPLCRPVHPSSPCLNFCLNVHRGCLTPWDEVATPWQDTIEEASRFVKDLLRDRDSSIEGFLESVPAAISDALIVARVEGPAIEKEMKRLCGSLKTENSSDVKAPVTSPPSPAGPTSPEGSPDLGRRLREVEAALEEARGLYRGLPEALCSGAKQDSKECWNGESVGEYTKPLVRPEADAQKYNPEVPWAGAHASTVLQQTIDNLRHLKKMLADLTNLSKRPGMDSLIEEEEGSGGGSGGGAYRPGDDEDDYPWAGSGSGERPIARHDGERDEDVQGRSGYSGNRGHKPVITSPDLTNLLTPERETKATGSSSRLIPIAIATLSSALVIIL